MKLETMYERDLDYVDEKARTQEEQREEETETVIIEEEGSNG